MAAETNDNGNIPPRGITDVMIFNFEYMTSIIANITYISNVGSVMQNIVMSWTVCVILEVRV